MGIRRKPVADRYRIGTNAIDTSSSKNGSGQAGRDGATFAGHNLRRGAISSRAPQVVHIARLKQFSRAQERLEESVEFDELQPHHPLKDVL
jgi:hypothetical protein